MFKLKLKYEEANKEVKQKSNSFLIDTYFFLSKKFFKSENLKERKGVKDVRITTDR